MEFLLEAQNYALITNAKEDHHTGDINGMMDLSPGRILFVENG